jgi:hypothetical protein
MYRFTNKQQLHVDNTGGCTNCALAHAIVVYKCTCADNITKPIITLFCEAKRNADGGQKISYNISYGLTATQTYE